MDDAMIPWTSDISEAEVLQSLELGLDAVEIAQYKIIEQYKLITISLVSDDGEPINFAESDGFAELDGLAELDGGEVIIGWLPDEQKGMDDEQKGMDLDFHYESGPVEPDSDPTDDFDEFDLTVDPPLDGEGDDIFSSDALDDALNSLDEDGEADEDYVNQGISIKVNKSRSNRGNWYFDTETHPYKGV